MLKFLPRRTRVFFALFIILAFVLFFGWMSKKEDYQHTYKNMDFSNLKLPKAETFSEENGLKVVYIPDNRSPTATFMTWLPVGSADEKPGKTGLAHFLEHLMFKGTKKVKPNEFAKIVGAQGGQLNAFTYYDFTGYYEEIDINRLPGIVEMEADRLVNLRLDEEEVLSERKVILEERRKSIDNNPAMLLFTHMRHQLFKNSSYQETIIGTMHDIAHLERQDALDFYKKYYAPNNVTLIVAGNLTRESLEALVKKYYASMKPSTTLTKRARVVPKPLLEDEVLHQQDKRAQNIQFLRMWLAPSPSQAGFKKSLAINMMAGILGSGQSSRLYKRLVGGKNKIAAAVSFSYDDSLLAAGSLLLSAVLPPSQKMAEEKKKIQELENAVNNEFERFLKEGPTDKEIERIKTNFIASYIHRSDDQMDMAHLYGESLTTGLSLDDIEHAPQYIQSISKEDIMQAAQTLLPNKTITGILSPVEDKSSHRG